MNTLTIAQLLRLPNVFTAFADIALAAFAAGYLVDDPLTFALLLASSGCLYCSGMVMNDLSDYDDDAKTRPFRPIPSGRVSIRSAAILALALLLAGITFAFFANAKHVSFILVFVILLYNRWLKYTPLGPLAMGSCRSLNIYLGLFGNLDGLSPLASFHLASTTGLYIVGVTWFARTEEGRSNKQNLILAAIVMLVALGLAITLPSHRPLGTTPFYFPYLIVAFGVFIAVKLLAAIRSPGPKEVQGAVKRCILGLILLDAILASAFVGWPGLLIVFLLLPARWLGQWVYST